MLREICWRTNGVSRFLIGTKRTVGIQRDSSIRD